MSGNIKVEATIDSLPYIDYEANLEDVLKEVLRNIYRDEVNRLLRENGRKAIRAYLKKRDNGLEEGAINICIPEEWLK